MLSEKSKNCIRFQLEILKIVSSYNFVILFLFMINFLILSKLHEQMIDKHSSLMSLFPKSNIIKSLNIFWLLNNISHSLIPKLFEFIVNAIKELIFSKYFAIIFMLLNSDYKLLFISAKYYKDLDLVKLTNSYSKKLDNFTYVIARNVNFGYLPFKRKVKFY